MCRNEIKQFPATWSIDNEMGFCLLRIIEKVMAWCELGEKPSPEPRKTLLADTNTRHHLNNWAVGSQRSPYDYQIQNEDDESGFISKYIALGDVAFACLRYIFILRSSLQPVTR